MGNGTATDQITTAGQTRDVTLPDGREAVIRKLTWTQMKAAAKAASSEQVAFLREMGGELLAALRGPRPSEDDMQERARRFEALQRVQARQPSQYEMATTLSDGVVSIDGQAQAPAGTLDVLALDPVAAEWLHAAIVDYAWEVPGKNG